MASTWKTFVPGEVLNAADVNDALNPWTADHLARAVATGTTTINCSSGAAMAKIASAQVIALPAGRFSYAPTVVAVGQAYLPVIVHVTAVTATSFTVDIYCMIAFGTGNVCYVRWIAEAM